MPGELALSYKSGSQQARVVTEAWGAENLYCPSCPSPKLTKLEHNTKAKDYECPRCGLLYQLKSQRKRLIGTVSDGDYQTMMNALQNDSTPNFYFMQYAVATWSLRNLLLVPSFAFPPSAIVKRNVLGKSAKRAGWVGCNFVLSQIPLEARILVVNEGQVMPENEVRTKYKRVKPLKEISAVERGWTLDVLTGVRSLNRREFTNAEIYALERHFEKLHPGNRHIRDKIRQQLQNLRDAGLVEHVDKGRWRMKTQA